MALNDSFDSATVSRDVAQTQAPLNEAVHVPGFIYNSESVFSLEKDRLFMKEWVCTIREEQVANPGDYIAMRAMGEPFIVCRDNDGNINAFANVCAHRGVEVASGEGNLKEFSCPYHGWLYDLKGKLIGAPYMKEAEGFDPANCQLRPLQVATWERWVFISFNPDAEPFDKFVEHFDREFGRLQMRDCRLGDRAVLEVNCNWKFINENLMDVYHFQTLHADSFGGYLDGEKFKIELTDRGGVSAFYKAAPMVPEGKSLFGPMPWMGEENMDLGCMGHLPPNLHIFGRGDAVTVYVIWPTAPDKTQVIIHHLFPAEHHELPDFKEKLKVYYDYQIMVVSEDNSMVEGMQRNMGSTRFVPGPMSEHEKTVHNIINGYLSRTFGEEGVQVAVAAE